MTFSENSLNILKDNKHKLYSRKTESNPYRASANFDIYKGNPQLSVWTNDKKDPNSKKPITARMSTQGFSVLCQLIKKVVSIDGPSRYFLINKTGKPSDKKIASRIAIGRDAEGIIYMMVLVEDRPACKLEFQIEDYTDIVVKDGTELTTAELSNIAALSYISVIKPYVLTMCHHTYEPYVKEEGKSYGNKSYTKKKDYDLDDLPV